MRDGYVHTALRVPLTMLTCVDLGIDVQFGEPDAYDPFAGVKFSERRKRDRLDHVQGLVGLGLD